MKRKTRQRILFFGLLFQFIACLTGYSQPDIWCGTEIEPSVFEFLKKTGKERQEQLQLRQANGTRAAGPIAGPIHYFAVKHHVIRKADGSDGASRTEIEFAMSNLNHLFLNANIQFYSCGEPFNYIYSDEYNNIGQDEDTHSLVANESIPHTINIFYVNSYTNKEGNTLCGNTTTKCIFMVNECVTETTLEHEMGHFFGLAHTHGDWNCPPTSDPGKITDEWVDGSNCSSTGDYICDTPADPNMGCGRDWVNVFCNYTGDVKDKSPEHRGFHPSTSNMMAYTRMGAIVKCREGFTLGQLLSMEKYADDILRSNYLCFPCAGSNVTITSNIGSGTTKEYHSLNDLYATNTIESGADIEYQARNRVILQPGFFAKRGVVFNANISCVYADPTNNAPLDVSASTKSTIKTETTNPLEVFPNPTSAEMTLRYLLNEEDVIRFDIYNLQGEKVSLLQEGKKETAGLHEKRFNLSHLAAGTYFIVLQGNNQVMKMSVVKTE